MKLDSARVFVTGADGGIGRQLSEQLLDRGVSHLYEGIYGLGTVNRHGRTTQVALDVTDFQSVTSAASLAQDLDLVINCAGIFTGPSQLDVEGTVKRLQREIDVNALGILRMTRAFGPGLARRSGRVVNMVSVTAWVGSTQYLTYAASKAAAWSLTNSLRLEWATRGVGVTGVFAGFVDTPLASGIDAPKSSPADIASVILDGIEADENEILCDDRTRNVKRNLSEDQELIYAPMLAGAEKSAG